MNTLFYQPKHAWVGDLIPYYENGTFYAFYLHDPRLSDREYGENTTWHLVTTKDFSHLTYQGEAITPGGPDAPNRNAYTGSVIRDSNGLCRAFYTGYNADLLLNGSCVQSVMQAVGPDPLHLDTVDDFLFLSDGSIYEKFDWRDPFVFWNEEENCYQMLLAARLKNGGALRGGCIALATSKDLLHFTIEKPFYAPHMYITMECPEVFRMGDYWYLVFSTFSDRFTTHYRYSKSLKGPWVIPEDDVFDTRANYAIKTASDGTRRFAFGWIASKYGNCDFGPWEWAGTMAFHEICQHADGTLFIKPTEGTKNYYTHELPLTNPVSFHLAGAAQNPARDQPERQPAPCGSAVFSSETLGAYLYDVPEDCFSLECTFRVKRAREFGLALHVDEGLETGYFLRMNPVTHTAAWDMWPRSPKGAYQWQIAGDVPIQIETMRRLPESDTYHLLVIRENDICVVYINDEIALSTRMYDHKGQKGGIYLIQGEAELLSFTIRQKKD